MFLVLGELVEELLLADAAAVFCLSAKTFGYVEHRHNGVGVDAEHLHLLGNLHRVLQCFGHIGEYGLHLRWRLEPLLLGIMHAVGVGIVLLGGQADKMVVCLSVLLFHKVYIVGGYQFDVVLMRQLYQHRVHLLLHLVG